MHRSKLLAMAVCAAAGVLGMTANVRAAATLAVNGSGILTGTQNVSINGTPYDVTFADGTCSAIFPGSCNSVSDFAFNTQSNAVAAANALLDQVFLDGSAGDFNSNPALTFGCSDPNACETLIPYGFFSPGGATEILIAADVNSSAGGTDFVTSGNVLTTFDTSLPANAGLNWAVFTPAGASVPVPQPATLSVMVAGLAGIGWIRRKRSSTSS